MNQTSINYLRDAGINIVSLGMIDNDARPRV